MPEDAGRPDYTIRSAAELRTLFEQPEGLAVQKSIRLLDRHCRDFIARSPFLCVSTMSADGKADVSPRGDPPGFVQVLDDRTLAIPDRPGNNRLDTMLNIVANPSVGILFFIPGFEDTLRVNGRATIVRDPALLAAAVVNGKQPKVMIKVAVDEAFIHCAKALKRARLWDPAARQDRREMPSIARIILEQVACDAAVDEAEAAKADVYVEDNYKNELY
jgi:PPOX class probable FMN-dependent enzyme